jgi:hypothetical protein
MKYEANSMGSSGFGWFVGVVEDRRTDPQLLGRLRVRVLGAHVEDLTLIPCLDLFYAYFYQSLTWNCGMNGLGHSPTGPVEGTWVFGFWRDEGLQEPVVLGVIGGIPQTADNPQIGFSDLGPPWHDFPNAPRKIRSRYYPNDGTGAQLEDETSATNYPRTTHPWGCIVGEADTNRLARAELVDDTIIGVRQRQRDVSIPIAFAHTAPTRQWNEPSSPYAAAYPYNHVYESESGHIVEIDDTPGAERLHIYHRSGTFIEIQGGTDGDFVCKVVGNRYEITMEHAFSHFQHACNVTVDGETNIYCRDTCNLQVDGDLNVHVAGDYTEKVQGNYFTDILGDRVVRIAGDDTLNVQGDLGVLVAGDSEHDVGGNLTVLVGGDSEHSAGGDFDLQIGGAVAESSGSTFHMAGGGILSGDAPMIFWNSGFGGPVGPDSPGEPDAPVVPPFPDPPGRGAEDRNETGPDPVQEDKPDVSPITA